MSMKRVLLVFPLLVPFVFHRIYQPINEAWTVKLFGCGCPPIDLGSRFNANHFNMIIWFFLMLTCAASWWLLVRRNFSNRRSKMCFVLQWVGVYAVVFICVKQFAHEWWL